MDTTNDTYRDLFEEAPLPYQSLDEAGCFLLVNQAWLDTLGYSNTEEVIGKWFGDLLVPEQRASFTDRFEQFKTIGAVSGVEYEMIKKDGKTIWVSFEGRIRYDDSGKFKQTFCTFIDITSRKKM